MHLAQQLLGVVNVLSAVMVGVTAGARTTEAPDDDRPWWGGMFYVNRDDPSLFVPRRAGAGMDLKLGNPWGLGCAVFVGLVALALVVVTLAMSLWARAPGVACPRPRCRLPAPSVPAARRRLIKEHPQQYGHLARHPWGALFQGFTVLT